MSRVRHSSAWRCFNSTLKVSSSLCTSLSNGFTESDTPAGLWTLHCQSTEDAKPLRTFPLTSKQWENSCPHTSSQQLSTEKKKLNLQSDKASPETALVLGSWVFVGPGKSCEIELWRRNGKNTRRRNYWSMKEEWDWEEKKGVDPSSLGILYLLFLLLLPIHGW